MSTVPASLLASAPLATASPDARAASATGGIDPPPSAGPDPSAAPAPLEPIAAAACARKVIRVFCETVGVRCYVNFGSSKCCMMPENNVTMRIIAGPVV